MAMTPNELEAVNGQLIGIGVTAFAALALHTGLNPVHVNKVWEYAKQRNEPLPASPVEAIIQMGRLISECGL